MSLEQIFQLPNNTYIFIPDLTINGGIDLIKAALADPNTKVYAGDAKRKTQKQRWLQHKTYGAHTPNVSYITTSNGVFIVEYTKYDTEYPENTERMQELAVELVKHFVSEDGKIPSTPGGIVRDRLSTLMSEVENKKGFKREDMPEDEWYYTFKSMMGGAVYNMKCNGAYRLVPFETHIDVHQLYAHIMKTEVFPDLRRGYKIELGYVPHTLGFYFIESGEVRLKENGFPLLSPVRRNNMEELECDREDYFRDWVKIPWPVLCEPDMKTLFENYDVRNLFISETMYYERPLANYNWNGFIDFIYNQRLTTTGGAKGLYKKLNEYVAGMFERKQEEMGKIWYDFSGPKPSKTKHHAFNCGIGSFITAYGRRRLSALLHSFPFEKIIGFDTDCVFFAGKPEEVPATVMKQFGDGMGQLHFDGIYHDVRHLAPKQYYGYDEDGEIFGKFSGVPNCDEVARELIANNDDLIMTMPEAITQKWNQKIQCFEEFAAPINKLCIEKYESSRRTDEEWLRKKHLIHGL